jgi:hypothetical protein
LVRIEVVAATPAPVVTRLTAFTWTFDQAFDGLSAVSLLEQEVRAPPARRVAAARARGGFT